LTGYLVVAATPPPPPLLASPGGRQVITINANLNIYKFFVSPSTSPPSLMSRLAIWVQCSAEDCVLPLGWISSMMGDVSWAVLPVSNLVL